MDPLSLAAGVIAVAGLAASTYKTIADLRSLCKGLPGRLHAVSNEVADLELVLKQVATLLEERATFLGSKNTLEAIPHLLLRSTGPNKTEGTRCHSGTPNHCIEKVESTSSRRGHLAQRTRQSAIIAG